MSGLEIHDPTLRPPQRLRCPTQWATFPTTRESLPKAKRVTMRNSLVTARFVSIGIALFCPNQIFAQGSNVTNSIGNIYNNQGLITQGQTGNNTIIQGPIPRRMAEGRADSLKAQILRELPRDKRITVMAVMGDGEAVQFAQEIFAFM